MYLKRLDIQGFKTFAERTQIVFSSGITCVIGPNGSGKSNIADAVQWVLGENNVRSLRGSSSQDVIFAGNDRRRPLGMAEVSLTIDNSGRILPLDFSEITVTRRLYRSGESECSINKIACRLRDIYELFLDTGVSRGAYSMIGQGEIDQILSVRSEDRRSIFEEAAGIKKYRVRKREAERKLEHTAQNLLRVHDIIAEIEGQLGPLQRQASAARRYQELAGKLRVLENAWYGARLRRLHGERARLSALVTELKGEQDRLDGELRDAQAAERGAHAALKTLDGEIDAQRQAETDALRRVAAAQSERARAEQHAGETHRRLSGLGRDLEELARRFAEQVERSRVAEQEEAGLRRDVDRLRSQVAAAQAAAQERGQAYQAAAADLERRRQAWLASARRQSELEAAVQSAQARVEAQELARKRAGEALEDAAAELERLTVERQSFLGAAEAQKAAAASLGTELEALKSSARQAEEALTKARSGADTAQRAHAGAQARLQALRELAERGEGAAAGAKRLLDAARRGHVPGTWSRLIDSLRTAEGLERAVEAALGPYGDALLCENDEQALAALDWLKGQKTTALLLPGSPSVAAEPLANSLALLVSAEGPALAWAHHLLSRTLLCESLGPDTHTPTLPHSHTPTLPDLHVTRDGHWRTRSGAMSAGSQGAEGAQGVTAAALARRRELDRMEAETPALQAALDAARAAVRTGEASAREAQSQLREKQTSAERARLEHQAQLREADRRTGDLERASHRVERLCSDVERAEREHAAALAAQEEARRRQESARSESGPSPAEPDLAAAQTAVGKLEVGRRQAEDRVTELRVRLAQQEQRLQAATAATRRAEDAGASLDRQRSDRLKEQRSLTAEAEQRSLQFRLLEKEVADADAEVARARERAMALTAQRAERSRDLASASSGGQELSARLRELMERSHRVEVELTALNAQRSHLEQQWIDAVAEHGETQEPGDAETQEPDPSIADCAPTGVRRDGLRIADWEPHTHTPTHPHDYSLRLPLTTHHSPERPNAERRTPNAETLLAAWNRAEAELVLASYSDPEGEIARLRRQIRGLGAINLDAVEQYARTRERHEFLTAQRADLEAARLRLEEAILEIDQASRETFLTAFRQIAAAFDEMFKSLFGGGTTELRLTDPNDVLETGIDVIVQPPGKKQQNLLLLSGGERALTAAAMLFALLKVRPSPFCVLDEVDAPLDENNVGRFIQVVRDFAERTQFIVVTHNRATMEGANTLYGVTMEERGVSKVLSCSLDDPVVVQTQSEARAGATV